MTRKPGRNRRSSSFQGSAEAKRLAAAILEGLAGIRGPQDASQALGISMTRYYQMEARALQGLVAALEPRRRGRQHNPQVVLARLERENLRRALEATDWQIAGEGGAAKLLGLAPSTLASRMKALRLRRHR